MKAVLARRPSGTSASSYQILLKEVQNTLHEGRKRAEALVEKEKLKTYWKVGQLIGHYLEGSQHGDGVILKLAGDLKTNATLLYHAFNLYQAYPNLAPARNLAWSHYKALLLVKDRRERDDLEKRADRESWSRRLIEKEIQKLQGLFPQGTVPAASTVRFRPKKGELNTYRIAEAGSALKLDLGFNAFLDLSRVQRVALEVGDIVTGTELENLTLEKEADVSWLYTYRARVEKVVDGDTLWLWIHLGFDFELREKVRLRAIDCPELGTAQGDKAKKFVTEILTPEVVVTTSVGDDKYGRYLADIYIEAEGGEIYLNKRLVEEGLAKLA